MARWRNVLRYRTSFSSRGSHNHSRRTGNSAARSKKFEGQPTGTFEGNTSSGGSSQGGGGRRWGWRWVGGGGASGFAQDLFSQEIKFIIVSSGNIQPTWKLIQVSANTGNTPFFSTGRTRTHDLIITSGPQRQRTANDFLATQIGQAVTGRAATFRTFTSAFPAQ